MKNIAKIKERHGLQRRSFLKIIGLSSLGLSLGLPFCGKWESPQEEALSKTMAEWKPNEKGNFYFVPQNLKTDFVNQQKKVSVKVDGLWKDFEIREFTDDFYSWWLEEKLWYYDQLMAFIEGESEQLNIPNGGHHHPMLSTYGDKTGGRGDSVFNLNTTAKGFTIIPKEENIGFINQEVEKVHKNGNFPVDLFKLKKQLYQEKDLWDKTRFATLELYSGRPLNAAGIGISVQFTETHTFQNIMANPISTLTYMAIYNTTGDQPYCEGLPYLTPHYEFRGVCWLISYYNPHNSEYEKAIADYVNQAHAQFHGGVHDITTAIFLIVEQFNNTPGYRQGCGKREVPPLTVAGQNSFSSLSIKPLAGKKLAQEDRLELIKKLYLPV